MSKIPNVGLTWSGTRCFIAVPIWQQTTVDVKGLKCCNTITIHPFKSLACRLTAMGCFWALYYATRCLCGLGSCKISPPRFLAEGRTRLSDQASFVLLYFVLFAFAGLSLVLWHFFLQYFDTVGWVFSTCKTVSLITYTVLVETLNRTHSPLQAPLSVQPSRALIMLNCQTCQKCPLLHLTGSLFQFVTPNTSYSLIKSGLRERRLTVEST